MSENKANPTTTVDTRKETTDHYRTAQSRFSQLPNRLVDTRRPLHLSLGAAGMWWHLKALGPSWQISIAGLVRVCDEGKTAVETQIKELQSKAMILCFRRRAEGRIVGKSCWIMVDDQRYAEAIVDEQRSHGYVLVSKVDWDLVRKETASAECPHCLLGEWEVGQLARARAAAEAGKSATTDLRTTESRFSQLPNKLVDTRCPLHLSHAAAGLLWRISSLGPGWQLSVAGLVEACDEGKTAVSGNLKELCAKGLAMCFRRHVGGKFAKGARWAILDDPAFALERIEAYRAAGYTLVTKVDDKLLEKAQVRSRFPKQESCSDLGIVDNLKSPEGKSGEKSDNTRSDLDSQNLESCIQRQSNNINNNINEPPIPPLCGACAPQSAGSPAEPTSVDVGNGAGHPDGGIPNDIPGFSELLQESLRKPTREESGRAKKAYASLIADGAEPAEVVGAYRRYAESYHRRNGGDLTYALSLARWLADPKKGFQAWRPRGESDGTALDGDGKALLSNLSAAAVNKNGMAKAPAALSRLLEAGYLPAEIASAWKEHQDRLAAEGREARYYTALWVWLSNPYGRSDWAGAEIDAKRRSAEKKAAAEARRRDELAAEREAAEREAAQRAALAEHPDYPELHARFVELSKRMMRNPGDKELYREWSVVNDELSDLRERVLLDCGLRPETTEGNATDGVEESEAAGPVGETAPPRFMDVDGAPIEVGDTVWVDGCLQSLELHVAGFRNGRVLMDYHGGDGFGYRPSRLTHMRPS